MSFINKIKKHQAVTAMSRGILVLDEHLHSLKPELEKRNIRILQPERGETDERIKHTLLPERIFVTNNAKDFEKDVSSFEFGLIDLPQALLADPVKAAKLISDAVIENKLWSLKKGFILRFKDDGSSSMQLMTD